jgi:hypothetical protein
MARNLLISAQTENIEAVYVALDQNGEHRLKNEIIRPTSASGVYYYEQEEPNIR